MANELSMQERDVLGEIGNISMGSAATSLSQLLRQEVSITTPQVEVMEADQLFNSFVVPYIAIKVNFTSGIHGFNLLIIKIKDAKTMLKLLMGDRVEDNTEFDALEMSALGEIMNQMMGSAATALNQVYKRPIKIDTPSIELVDVAARPGARPDLVVDEDLVTVAFRFKISNIVDSQAIQVMPFSSAREQAGIMLANIKPPREEGATQAPRAENENNILSREVIVERAEFPPLQKKDASPTQPRGIEFLLDIPLDASVVLGTTSKTIQEVLALREGSIVELNKLVEEPVELFVNGLPVARGEIVVVNENFGLRITEIVSSAKRLETLSSLRKV